MTEDDTWHGLSAHQWREVWGYGGLKWQRGICNTLEEIARTRDAAVETRLGALVCLNQSLQSGLLPAKEMMTPYPVLARNVLLEMSLTSRKPGWWARRRQRRVEAGCLERLTASKYTLATAAEFVLRPGISVVDASTTVGFTPAVSVKN